MRLGIRIVLVGLVIFWMQDLGGSRIVQTAEEAGNLVQYRPGDILIAAISPVHKRENERCSTIQDLGIQIVEMINMVIDQINANETILPQIKLGTVMIDSCFSDTHTVRQLVTNILPMMLNKRTTHCYTRRLENSSSLLAGVLGGVASAVSIQAASILQALNVPQVSYLSTSPELSDKIRFKYFFRVVPSDMYQADAILEFVQQRNWTYISVVHEDDAYGIRGLDEIRKLAEKYLICISVELSVPRSPEKKHFRDIIQKLVNTESKVVVVFTKSDDASKLMTAAQNSNDNKARDLFWIASDGWTQEIPRSEDNFNDTILHGTVGFRPTGKAMDDFDVYFRNLTVGMNLNNARNPWFTEYIAHTKECYFGNIGEMTARECDLNETVNQTSFYNLAQTENVANAVLALVYALDEYHKSACKGAPGLCPEISNHTGTNGLASNLYPILRNITFTNSNGKLIHFDENQDGPSIYDITTYRADEKTNGSPLEKWKPVGVHDKEGIRWSQPLAGKVLQLKSACSDPCTRGEARIEIPESCCWRCVKCADGQFVNNETKCSNCEKAYTPNFNRDGCDPKVISEISYAKSYGIICGCIAGIGFLLSLAVTGIFIKYRDTPIAKASGSELCFFVLMGISLTFLNFFAMMTSPTYISCILSRVILGLGPACMYAGLLNKTVRVVIIFHSKSSLSAKIKAYLQPLNQVISTVGLVLIQALVLFGWFVASVPEVKLHYLPNDVVYQACRHLVDLEVLIALLYPFLLIIACTVLATVNRRVPVGFNETKYIGFSMYTTCIIWLAFLPTFITNNTDYGQRIMTTSICLSLSASTVLICLFVPKCFKLLFRPALNQRNAVMSPSRDIKATTETPVREARSVSSP